MRKLAMGYDDWCRIMRVLVARFGPGNVWPVLHRERDVARSQKVLAARAVVDLFVTLGFWYEAQRKWAGVYWREAQEAKKREARLARLARNREDLQNLPGKVHKVAARRGAPEGWVAQVLHVAGHHAPWIKEAVREKKGN